MGSHTEAPKLEQFFSVLSQGAVNYCVVCLRTETEVKLLKSEALKKFSNCMKMDKNWKHYHICCLCERQATKALRFFRAATFAAAIDTIFAELLYQKNNKYMNVFEKNIFKKILRKFGLGKGMTSPKEWEAELDAVRKSTNVCQTKPLVFNLSQKPQNDAIPPPADTKVISSSVRLKDKQPVLNAIKKSKSSGTVTTVTTSSQRYSRFPDGTRQPRCYGNRRTAHRNVENLTSPSSSQACVDETDDVIILNSQIPNEIVLPDDDEEDIHITITNCQGDMAEFDAWSNPTRIQTTSQPVFEQNLSTSPLNHSINQSPSTPRSNGALNNVLERPKEVLVGDGLLQTNAGLKYVMHPVTITPGVATIQSLDGPVILDGYVVQAKVPGSKVFPMVNTENMNLQDMIQCPALPPLSPLTYSAKNNTGAAVMTDSRKTPDNAKKESLEPYMATPSTKVVMLPAQNAITDGSRRIDWEDKIPMDVISFVDAVDPNHGQILTSQHQGKPTVATWKSSPPAIQDSIKNPTTPSVTDTLVILDDEDDPPIKIDKVETNIREDQAPSQSNSKPTLEQNSTATSQNQSPKPQTSAPRLVPLENLLERPKDMFNGDSSERLLKDGAVINHSIEGHIMFVDCAQNVQRVFPMINSENVTLQDLIQIPELSPTSSGAIYSMNNNNTEDAMMTDNGEPPEFVKGESPDLDVAVPAKKLRMLPAQSAVADRNRRIDWEDKIPMDVISFMDAVDPNRDQILPPIFQGQSTATPQNSSNPALQNAVKKEVPSDVIDLC